jgi:hypothetical protein
MESRSKVSAGSFCWLKPATKPAPAPSPWSLLRHLRLLSQVCVCHSLCDTEPWFLQDTHTIKVRCNNWHEFCILWVPSGSLFLFVLVWFWILIFETGSHYILQADLGLMILLSQSRVLGYHHTQLVLTLYIHPHFTSIFPFWLPVLWTSAFSFDTKTTYRNFLTSSHDCISHTRDVFIHSHWIETASSTMWEAQSDRPLLVVC